MAQLPGGPPLPELGRVVEQPALRQRGIARQGLLEHSIRRIDRLFDRNAELVRRYPSLSEPGAKPSVPLLRRNRPEVECADFVGYDPMRKSTVSPGSLFGGALTRERAG